MTAHSEIDLMPDNSASGWRALVTRYHVLRARPEGRRDLEAEAAMREIIPFAYGIPDRALREEVLAVFADQLGEPAFPERGRHLIRPLNPLSKA